MRLLLAVLLGAGLAVPAARAQEAPAAPPDAAEAPDDLEIDEMEPDVTLLTLPTTFRLPAHHWAFRVTHRFARPLGRGDFSDLASDLFGFDGGAQIGLELRFAPFRGTQLGVHRTSDRTIALFAEQNLLDGRTRPLGLSALASVEGLDNFSEQHSPRLGVVVSRRLGTRATLYAVPAWVGNVDAFDQPGQEDGVMVLGLGARLRLGESWAVLGEVSPQLAGYESEAPLIGFALERTVGGHVFQLNVSNDLGTTAAQVARGRLGPDDWYIGFNISRKFY